VVQEKVPKKGETYLKTAQVHRRCRGSRRSTVGLANSELGGRGKRVPYIRPDGRVCQNEVRRKARKREKYRGKTMAPGNGGRGGKKETTVALRNTHSLTFA